MKKTVFCRARRVSALTLAVSLALLPSLAMAADNTGAGDIAGVSADLTDSNTFQLSATTLALIKRAFLSDGTALTSGTSVPSGTIVKFMIYVNNDTAVPVTDLSVQDVLDAAFNYQAGTIKVDNTQTCAATACTSGEEATIYTNVDDNTALTDAVAAGDVGSITGSTIDIGNANVANDQLDINANNVWVLLFTVEVN